MIVYYLSIYCAKLKLLYIFVQYAEFLSVIFGISQRTTIYITGQLDGCQYIVVSSAKKNIFSVLKICCTLRQIML